MHANEHPPGTRYEREVAGGAEDYYAMRGEAAGEWTRSGAQTVGPRRRHFLSAPGRI